LFLAASAVGLPSQAQNPKPAEKHDGCFFSNQFESWRAPDDKTILIRVGLTRYYRLDLSASCSGLTSPGARLISRLHGSGLICKPIDWDISLEESTGGFGHGCIVKSMTELAPDEVASLPSRYRP
jgi:hypothetical protein